MKIKYLVFLFGITMLLTGCGILGASPTTPIATAIPITNTPSPYDALVGLTPNVSSSLETSTATSTVSVATPTATAIVTNDPAILQNKIFMNAYLPTLNSTLRFYGIAETGHFGNLTKGYIDETEAMYQFNGTYDDGMGVPDKFKVQYFFNFTRGTITEKAISNERLGKAEFHSKLHNIVVLKFPLSLGSTWSHSTTIDGSKYWVSAEVTEYSSDTIKVRYTAADVPGYYNNTYIETRTFEKGYGMTFFANIIPGELDFTGVDTTNENEVMEYIMNMYMFGYGLQKD